MKLWAGQAVSELGSTVTRDALPLLAVLTLGASPFEMGVLSALGGLPLIFFGIFAGVWVDRLRRRPLMIIADLGRALLLGAIPLSAALGFLRIELVYAIVILAGLLGVVFNTAYRAYLPALVERSHLVEGNSKLALSSSVAEIGGSGLAGVLVQWIGAPFAMLLDAFSFLASAGSLALIRKPEPPVVPPVEQPSVLREAREGLSAVSAQPALRALLGAEATLSLLGNMIGPLYGLYAIRELGLSPAALGLTIALGGVSSLVGALLAERAVRRFGLGATLVSMLALMSISAHAAAPGRQFQSAGLFLPGRRPAVRGCPAHHLHDPFHQPAPGRDPRPPARAGQCQHGAGLRRGGPAGRAGRRGIGRDFRAAGHFICGGAARHPGQPVDRRLTGPPHALYPGAPGWAAIGGIS